MNSTSCSSSSSIIFDRMVMMMTDPDFSICEHCGDRVGDPDAPLVHLADDYIDHLLEEHPEVIPSV